MQLLQRHPPAIVAVALAEELHELERNYTPCDVINDYTAGKRILRSARPGLDRFNLIEAVA